MGSRLRSQRLWQILEQFPRTLLYRLGQAAHVSARSGTYKHDVIEMLCALPEAVLERALADGLTRPDLQDLCRRLGRVDTGSKPALAARIMDAVDEPAAQSPRWRPFAEARAFARRLELTGQKEWYAFVRGRLPVKGTRPADIPSAPQMSYAKAGWTTWGDFLGTGNPARRLMTYRPFREARAYARRLGLANTMEWRALCRARSGNRRVLPHDIPSLPERVYAGRGWAGYGDWLGTGNVRPSKNQRRSYEAARAFVRSLGIRSEPQWRAYCRGELDGLEPRPLDMPSHPQRAYRGRGWVSWGHFFGSSAATGSGRKFRSFSVARAYVRAQRLRNSQAWRAWCAAGHRPPDIPATPNTVYRKQGWVSWGDFLGTGQVHPSRVRRRSFAAMRAFVRRLGLRTRPEYLAACREGRIPRDILRSIERHPAWKGWADFLGSSYAGRRSPAKNAARPRSRRG